MAELSEALVQYGWDAQWEATLADLDTADQKVGRVTRVDRGEVDVATDAGFLRVLSDSQRAQAETAPATGDWIVIREDANLGPVVGQVMPRRTAITRRDPAEGVIQQVLVANVDLVAVVHGLDHDIRPARIERFMALAYDSGAKPIVLLTKDDLVDGTEAVTLVETFVDTDSVPILRTKALEGGGIEELRTLIGNKTIVLLGLSGCGKSTLTNALLGDYVQPTGAVREGDARGRHTTTSRDLFLLPGGGVLIDTPGVRSIGLVDATAGVEAVFADIVALGDDCRFNDCTHRHEPGCAVRIAIADGEISGERVDRYFALIDEQSELDDQREAFERKNRRRGRR